MPQIKVCVYGICKDESQFIKRWMESASEADCIAVLDTGSNDCSLEMLRTYPAVVSQEIITPWRFDTARNKALALIPEDVDLYISLDMDEILLPGWYQKITKAWISDATAAQCRFVWHFNEDGSEGGVFWPIRIHTRHEYIWTHPIHEVLTYTGKRPPKVITINDVQFNHYPDPHKKRDYLTLLENAVVSNPSDSRDLFYLGREYSYHQNWEKCIEALTRYLKLSSWKEERSAAMRLMAKSFYYLNNPSKAVDLLLKAHKECPSLREPLIDLALIYYQDKNWDKSLHYIEKALEIPSPSQVFINDGYAWDATPYDLASIAHFYLGHYDKALACALTCLQLAPNNKRFTDNVKFFQEYILSH